jgi:subtilase family serine protease
MPPTDTPAATETATPTGTAVAPTATPTSGLPDLIVSSITNPPAMVSIGSTFTVTDTTLNQGGQTAGASRTRYLLSFDTVRSFNDRYLGLRTVPVLPPGASSTGSLTVLVHGEVTPGTYYLLACADDTLLVVESDESNNCLASTTTVMVVP